jgi:hypothetical protein
VEAPEPNPNESTADQSKPEGLLYHYTGQNALLGILESRKIWATHVRYLNDESEFVHSWKKVWDSLSLKIKQKDFQEKDPNFRQSLEKMYRVLRDEIMKDPQRTTYYVICFTDDKASDSHSDRFDGDRLSQWRGYSKGGYGFSLGFDASALLNSFTASGNVVQWVNRCEYSEFAQNAQIDQLTSKHCDGFLNSWTNYFSGLQASSLAPAEYRKNNVELLMNPLMEMCAEFVQFGMFIKHPAFREENEWRVAFVAQSSELCLFRPSNFGLTPYIEIGISLLATPSPLRRIVVGPGPHKNEWVTTLQFLLAKYGISGIEVVPSQIPYRNW